MSDDARILSADGACRGRAAEAERLAIEDGFYGVEPGGLWKGMRTWYPIATKDPRERPPKMGIPLFILDDNGSVRWCTPQEAEDRVFS